jgi:hypothetical protein
MKTVIKNNIKYKFEGLWKSDINDTNNKLDWPEDRPSAWSGKDPFMNKLHNVEKYLKSKKKFYLYKSHKKCLLCQKPVISGIFKLNKILWEDGYMHYIDKHNIKPSSKFLDVIYIFTPKKQVKLMRVDGVLYEKNALQFIKVERNQLMILDALMEHGGYTKKYMDSKNHMTYRYSEHFGLIDFHNSSVDKIIISGKTSRVDEKDNEIYLPRNIPEILDYEYMFHTHPPTPKPGGRVQIGILYEVPSICDIFYFINKFNKGQIQGSIIVAAEGLYIIRALNLAIKKIKINEKEFYKKIKKVYNNVQKNSIAKYGHEFTNDFFYSTIAQNTQCIDDINKTLNQYKLHVDFYSRIKVNNRWILETVYLPVYTIDPVVEK